MRRASVSGCDECNSHFGELHADGCRTAQREDADAAAFRFHGHLDMCRQCRDNPLTVGVVALGLCDEGARLLTEGAESCATLEELHYLDDRIFGKRRDRASESTDEKGGG